MLAVTTATIRDLYPLLASGVYPYVPMVAHALMHKHFYSREQALAATLTPTG